MMQTLQWVGYCILVSGALALGATALEAAARASGRAGRWAWVAALVASVAIPLVSYLRPVHVVAGNSSVMITSATFTSAAGAVEVASKSAIHPGLLLWIAASVAVLAFIVLSYMRLAKARNTWELSHVDGIPVLLSHDVGPAALGVVSSDIVLPRWVLSLEERALNLMMLHEREHLRMWDPRLMIASLVLIAVMPWNPLVWLMVQRLRLAIELDCDARVLTRSPDPARYGAVLLEVSRHRARMSFALSTFAEPRSQMEHRIRRMAEWPGNKRLAHALALCVLALTMTGAAYAVRVPIHARVITDIQPDGSIVEPSGTGTSASSDTLAPMLRNEAFLAAEIDRAYPPLLRDAGIMGVTTVMVYVDVRGKSTKAMIKATSGYDAFDAAALRLVPVMEFLPAVYKGRRVAHWIAVDVPFGIRKDTSDTTFVSLDLEKRIPAAPPVDTALLRGPVIALKQDQRLQIKTFDVPITVPPKITPQPASAPPPPSRMMSGTSDGAPLSAAPVFTPMTVAPKLLNTDEVQSAIARFYPALLRDAGIGGKTTVWFFIDETGRAQKWLVNTPSGYEALDVAAMKVAPVMRFTPAVNQDRAVSVWVSFVIAFKVD